MVYRKRYNTNRRWYRKKRFGTNRYYNKYMKYKYNKVVPALVKGLNDVRKNLNVEWKHKEGSYNNTPDITNGWVQRIPNIAEGTGDDERNGSSIRMKKVMFKIETSKNAAVPISKLRFWLVNDTYPDAGAPVLGELLDDPAVNGYYSFRNTDHTDRLKVLKAWNVYLDDINRTYNWKEFMFPYDYKVKFNGTGGSNVTENNLYIIVQSDCPVNMPSVVVKCKYYWIDN